MMGTALFNLDVPVSKTSSALVCLSEDEVSKTAQLRDSLRPMRRCLPIVLFHNYYTVMPEQAIKKTF